MKEHCEIIFPTKCCVHDMPIKHVLDVMHVEKNVAESVLKFLFGEKDTLESQRDLQAMGMRHEL